jgi:hypothetical protein
LGAASAIGRMGETGDLRVARFRLAGGFRRAAFSGALWIFMPIFWHSFQSTTSPMARDANPLKSELITLSLNTQTVWYLDRLVETGLYGNNRTEAARVALYDHCKLLIAQDRLAAAPPLSPVEIAERGASAVAPRR